VPYVVAGLVAAGALLVEQHWQQRLWYTVQASGWWAARLLAEAAWGIALSAALLHLPKHVLAINGIVLGVLAGLAAPRLLGAKALTVRNHNLSFFNLAYKRVTEQSDRMIDSHSAEAQRRYLDEIVRPAVQDGRLQLAAVIHAFREHINGRRGMTNPERAEKLAFIKKVEEDSTDATAQQDDNVATLVLRAWEIGAYGALQNVLRDLPRRKYGSRAAVGRVTKRVRQVLRLQREGQDG
jgi:type II secretory pathway pseudopilin PulG